MPLTNAQGTKIFYNPTANATPPALAAGAYPASPYVEVGNGQDVETVPMSTSEYDNSVLGDTVKSMAIEVGPGSITFTRMRDQNSAAIRALADGTTLRTWVVCGVDGIQEYVTGYLIPVTGASASRGFANKITEKYKVVGQSNAVAVQNHT